MPNRAEAIMLKDFPYYAFGHCSKFLVCSILAPIILSFMLISRVVTKFITTIIAPRHQRIPDGE